jgi:uncharacterized protein (DUF1330 family)
MPFLVSDERRRRGRTARTEVISAPVVSAGALAVRHTVDPANRRRRDQGEQMTAEPTPSPNAARFERTYGNGKNSSQPPVAYVISAVDGFVDEPAVKRYAELAGPAIQHFNGRFIVSNTEPLVVEGVLSSSHLSMVEFPSMEDAKAWYNSAEYAEARDLTPAAFRGRLLIFVEAG